jgi:predicted membrane protein
MSDKTRHSDSGRIFWGLALILVGALVLLKRFDIWDLGYLLSTWWPAILILIGISLLIGNRFRRPGAGLLLIIIGAMFLLWELGYLEVDVWRKVWPAALIVIGLWIIFRPVIRPRSSGTVPPAPGDDIDVTAVFSGAKRRIETQGFKGGEATAVFGGADLDFTNAGLEGGRATVEATAIFGGVDIIVPKNWRVIMDGTPILGGFNLKHANPPEAEAKATLHVRGTAIFGGVTVKD